MAINTIEYAKIFMASLDKQVLEGATSGWMEANASQVKYNGGNEVKLPKISMSGLGNYDRDKGFLEGAVSLIFETRKMENDRGRTFQLDAMDVDETNFSAVAGNVMGEFQRTKVIPEIDAYRYSTIAKKAVEASLFEEYTPEKATVLSRLLEDIGKVQDIAGDGEELVITMSVPCAITLDQSESIEKHIDLTDFKNGGASFKTKALNGIPIIRVPSGRMKTAFDFFAGEAQEVSDGGFAPLSEAKGINWIICSKKAPIAVSKTDVTRIFDPMTNQKANAWKIDYRKYHDLWITDNGLQTVFVNIGE